MVSGPQSWSQDRLEIEYVSLGHGLGHERCGLGLERRGIGLGLER